ncbi:MAG TPA: hypothetical protein VEH84_03125 [Alphaproteobacteria bacterium]|nr:hypothetical protein [Alphaproteobacteria bacterium]
MSRFLLLGLGMAALTACAGIAPKPGDTCEWVKPLFYDDDNRGGDVLKCGENLEWHRYGQGLRMTRPGS